jgi:hypothetical protein
LQAVRIGDEKLGGLAFPIRVAAGPQVSPDRCGFFAVLRPAYAYAAAGSRRGAPSR